MTCHTNNPIQALKAGFSLPHGSRKWQPLLALPRRKKFSHCKVFSASWKQEVASLLCLGGKNFRIAFVMVRWRMSLAVVMLGAAGMVRASTQQYRREKRLPVAAVASPPSQPSSLAPLWLVSSFLACLASSILSSSIDDEQLCAGIRLLHFLFHRNRLDYLAYHQRPLNDY
ncbi:hypothetical protein PIB30_071938 [Stylosanthes scabra]|uniref:Uncharacterized protein n=1 Tax=Stylosanthes scabra TaxID=79078 RepID=A0ABU6ZMJ5_9FABA|nr:hypothetical protein [Stylosanthes scabra]